MIIKNIKIFIYIILCNFKDNLLEGSGDDALGGQKFLRFTSS